MLALSRDFVLLAHILLGFSLIILPIIIINLKKNNSLLKPLSLITVASSWIMLFVAGRLYIIFYPATKALVKSGAWPWAHLIIMETKEHWGLLLPIITTIAAGLVFKGRIDESRKWWILVIVLSILIGVMGRIITMGALK